MRTWFCPKCDRRWETDTDIAMVIHECRARQLKRTIPIRSMSLEEYRQSIWKELMEQ